MENVKVECCESENSEVVERILEDAYCDYQDEELSNTNDSNAPGSSVRDNENEESELCDDDSKAIIEQLIDDKGKIWDRKYIINSGVEGTVSDCNVKIEIDAIEEKPFFDETESSIVDSKTFTKQLIDERGIWKTESGTSQEDCGCSTEKKLHENSLTAGIMVSEGNIHECQNCDYVALEKSKLRRHTNSVHSRTMNHKCKICDFTTSRKDTLKGHIDSVHLKVKGHKCHMCHYTTARKHLLQNHMDCVHLNVKNYKCRMCDYSTSWKSNLNCHVNSVHLKVKNQKCPMCEYRASNKSHLKVHFNGVHLKVKSHECPMCDYTATRKEHIKIHLKGVHHKGNRPGKRGKKR